MPNKQDGKTYSRISSHPRKVEIFCAWNLIIQVASRMPTRGILVDGDGPLDAQDLADRTRYPVEAFEIALDVLAQPRFGWIDVEFGESTNGSVPPAQPVIASVTPADASVTPADAGTEGKGTERKGREKAGTLPTPPFDSPEFLSEWGDYQEHRKQMRKPLTKIACSRLFKQFEQWGEARAIAALKHSMADGRTWQGVFEPPTAGGGTQAPMFKAPENPDTKALRENCTRCRGTGNEVVPGKGARPCDHLPLDEESE